ncbi:MULTISPECIES: ABC transporter substrate-binding protein [Pseudomonas fluorescens group]|uniref:ABC transporter substrate-binding protein n=2 Tax=Gammaproteobacteria TaxID=1236 RepID=A0ABS8R1N7_9PSED|nr:MULTISPECIES: ABC transporter substrate-binding protein [Pseudomonas fluorescens group]MCD7041900.1 ABC transporter substrate-binding protein [Pseudomonas petroselini]MCD7068116.1 ABC transporter substrate-binding protein [Pseudomonas petroselini]MCD7078660.1 ABC transporter substrate-binding protein [Pseudomonas petroselini]MCF5666996.1 ABC transporter substrate-binding protein [Pseudomonas marginalis]
MGDSSRMTCLFITSLWRRAVLLACLLWAAPAWSADILLTAAEDGAGVQAFAQALAQQRPEDHVTFTPLNDLPAPSRLPASTRLILLDLPGLDWRLQDTQGPPTLVLRISRLQAHQRLGTTQHPRISLLWSDPAQERQLRLIAAILPQARRIGVLYSADSEFLLPELRQHAKPLGLEIVPQRWDNTSDSRPLQTLFRNSDVLLGLDDPQLYNPKTAKNLLLSSYAQQLPLVGPNAGFVRAGSLASTYSDQTDWLAVLDRLLDLAPANWPHSLYPEHFKVVGNPQVARSLGIEQVDEANVALRLAEGEKRP